MPLEPGTSLGSYNVVALIGKGGMGEVYRATDTKLKREVAIKVLPEDFAQDPARMKRFEREAQLLASLNHPNIAAIHELGRIQDTTFLVLELVEGEDLADRLKRGPIPVDEALAIARQLIDALEFAHAKGIIHRDLKPPNIKLREDGTIKVLDFGLAKALVDETETNPESSQSPTLTRAATQAGVLLGTAGYMSPEQARGKKVDKRADVWAFGCILYEMLTGQRLFQGETVSDTLASVLKTDPDWSALPAETPTGARRLLRRLLARDLSKRLQAIGDARLDLDEDDEPGAAVEASVPARWKLVLPWTIAAALAVVALLLARNDPRPEPSPVAQFAISDPVELDGNGYSFALSPDGSLLVYRAATAGLSQLYLRPLDTLEATPIAGTEMSRGHTFSPDGRWVAFLTAQGEVKKYSVADGSVLPVTAPSGSGVAMSGISWGADDRLVMGGATGLQLVSADGSTVKNVTELDPAREATHVGPVFLPGGRFVLFTRFAAGDLRESALEVLDLDTGERRTLVERASGGFYALSGHLLFHRDGALLATPFDLERVEVSGPSVQALEPILTNQGSPNLTISDTGILVYATERAARLVWVDRNGREESVSQSLRNYGFPRIAPGADLVAFTTQRSLWVLDPRRDTFTQLSPRLKLDGTFAIWTANGRHVVYNDGTELMMTSVERSGPDEHLPSNVPGLKLPASVSPDGSELAFLGYTENGSDVFIVPLDGTGEPRAFLESPAYEGGPKFSPDGRLLAYVVQRVRTPRGLRHRLSGSGREVAGFVQWWNARGVEPAGWRALLPQRREDDERTHRRQTRRHVEAGRCLRRQLRLRGGPDHRRLRRRSGRREVFDGEGRVERARKLGNVRVVLNWFDELERLAPTH